MKRIFILILLVINLYSLLYSQAYSPPLRLEIETPLGEFPFQIVPMHQNGVALFYETGFVENKQMKWSIVLFDTNLKKTTTSDFLIEKEMNVEAFNADEENVYICLQNSYRRKTLYNTVLIHYSLPENKIKIFSFNLRDREEVQYLYLYKNCVLFTTYYDKKEESFLLDLKTITYKPLHTDNSLPYSLQFFHADSISQSLWVGSLLNVKQQSKLILHQLDSNGHTLFQKEIDFDEQFRVNSCKWIMTDSGQALIVGTYVNANEVNVKNSEEFNTGIVSLSFSKDKIDTPLFYNFLFLTNENYMRSNKQDVSLNLHLVINDIVHNDSLYVFVAEVFYPEYRQEYATGYGMYGYASAPTTVFAGYRYQIAYVLVFNKYGELLWNTQFQYKDLMVKSLRNILRAHIDDENNILLYYGLGDEVTTTVLNDKNVVQSVDKIPMELLAPGEQILQNYTAFCKHWYHDYFIYYGYQTILSPKTNKNQKRKRDVLFINKLVYK